MSPGLFVSGLTNTQSSLSLSSHFGLESLNLLRRKSCRHPNLQKRPTLANQHVETLSAPTTNRTLPSDQKSGRVLFCAAPFGIRLIVLRFLARKSNSGWWDRIGATAMITVQPLFPMGMASMSSNARNLNPTAFDQPISTSASAPKDSNPSLHSTIPKWISQRPNWTSSCFLLTNLSHSLDRNS